MSSNQLIIILLHVPDATSHKQKRLKKEYKDPPLSGLGKWDYVGITTANVLKTKFYYSIDMNIHIIAKSPKKYAKIIQSINIVYRHTNSSYVFGVCG